jgi:hydroxymethylpyrimidine/phosphomethylpyrimidine kinase
MKRTPDSLPVVLTIAGSDSGGGAGIQADLHTFAALGVFGTSAVTCLTAQNPDTVTRVDATDPEMVREQVRTVCAGFPVNAAKTGMLFSVDIIKAVAAAVHECAIPNLVVDPVMVATSGALLLQKDAIEALCRVLAPRARVLTPNLPEAEILRGGAIEGTRDGLCGAARDISLRFGAACVVKGGHLPGTELMDVLYAEGQVHVFEAEMLPVQETHGTGCTFSAALAACLAHGCTLPEGVRKAQRFVGGALRDSVAAGEHYPLHWSSSCAP